MSLPGGFFFAGAWLYVSHFMCEFISFDGKRNEPKKSNSSMKDETINRAPAKKQKKPPGRDITHSCAPAQKTHSLKG
jgi:hypothetical protein